jgi:2-C-methyl-D-erythritol 2,4-cyclodiphosphate synthase
MCVKLYPQAKILPIFTLVGINVQTDRRIRRLLMRVGLGYDTHRLVAGRKLILGGVCIPYSHGLLGHSDADVLVHAIIDALLGAAGLGDIGRLFPDSDERYKGVSSLVLLAKVAKILTEMGFIVCNIDSVVIAQVPKLAPYIEQMESNISRILDIDSGYVNVKATTEEGLGFTGSGEGISAKAICCIREGISERT